MNIELVEQTPKPEEYSALRVAAGLSPKSIDAAKLGLPRSLFSVCIRQEKVLIGMGRIVGDGGCNFEVVDIAVHPDFQGRGLGSQIMTLLMDYLKKHAPKTAYVSLIADGEAYRLYQKFGFAFTAPASAGMFLEI